MLIIIAVTEAITEKNPFIPQRNGSSFALTLLAAAGNAVPMKNESGARTTSVMMTLTRNGAPSVALRIGERRNITRRRRPESTMRFVRFFKNLKSLKKLPNPENSNIENRAMERLNDGCPR